MHDLAPGTAVKRPPVPDETGGATHVIGGSPADRSTALAPQASIPRRACSKGVELSGVEPPTS